MLLDVISKSTGLRKSFIERVVHSAPYSYKKYTIPKKNGGVRVIHHPRKELKVVQRWIVEHVISDLPVHDSVYSYRKGRGIRLHAEIHKNNNYLLRLDLRNFFPSIRADDIYVLVKRYRETLKVKLSDDDIKTICRILCIHSAEQEGLFLTIGAPSSPAISNAILYSLDLAVDQFCEKIAVKYTRYADDLYFSTNRPNVLTEVESHVRNQLKKLSNPTLLINEEKTVFTSRKRKRVVTGITLTSDNKLSIGREAKRRIKTEVFLLTKGQFPTENLANLKGRIAYFQSIEPGFINSLRIKFGEEVIRNLIKQ